MKLTVTVQALNASEWIIFRLLKEANFLFLKFVT